MLAHIYFAGINSAKDASAPNWERSLREQMDVLIIIITPRLLFTRLCVTEQRVRRSAGGLIIAGEKVALP